MLLTFLQGVFKEIGKDDYKKAMKYVLNMLKITISYSKLFQPVKMLSFCHIFKS